MKRARSSSLVTDKGRSRHKGKRNLPVFFRAVYFKDAALAEKDGSFRSYVYFLRFFRCLHSLANRKRENLQGVFDPLSIRLLFSTGSHGSARRPRVKRRPGRVASETLFNVGKPFHRLSASRCISFKYTSIRVPRTDSVVCVEAVNAMSC